ncbi:MAG: hypothetical protein ACI9U0_000575 [Flavobacteriales bacterium]|jgi:hypothetical protein|tara:strand:+ start:10351 stop:10896 length:546 start_codon:yes stop_codon:yes gene_type:complete
MKKLKIYIKYAVGSTVTLMLCFAIISTIISAKADIPDHQVEELAFSLKLVDENEAQYPSIIEMEDRIKGYYAGENFADAFVRISLFLIVSVIVITLCLSGYKLAKNKQKLLRFLIPAGGLILVFIISRIFASSSTEGLTSTMPFTEGQLINVSTLVNVTLTLLIISFTALGTYRIKHILTK